MMLELLVKATLVLGVAAVFEFASRGRVAASTRHAAWVAPTPESKAALAWNAAAQIAPSTS